MAGVNWGMVVLALVLTALAGYLLGSINFAIIISRLFYKEDVRTKGSGNAGMTNVLRSYGKWGGAFTLAGDAAKGILAVWVGRWLLMALAPELHLLYGAYVGGICAIVGHMFPVFFGFRGGKGVAVSAGVILGLQPIILVILVAIFLLLFFISRMVSLGSVLGIVTYGPVTFIYYYFWQPDAPRAFATACSVIISLLVIWMHRANIKRILAGTEYKFGEKKKQDG